jgi:hypothetical protein
MDNSALPKEGPNVNREVMEEPVSSQEPLQLVEEAVEVDIDENEMEEDVPYDANSLLQREMSVQIAPTEESFVEDNPMLYIQLGDRVVIDSTRYGRSVGRVYYRSLDIITIKPDNVSNIIQTFEMEEVDDEEVYKKEYGVVSAMVVEKRIYESFVEQQDFRVGQLIDTFDAAGAPVNSYTITAVDKDTDMITIQDIEDKEVTKDVLFNFIGIEPDEDFAIISIRQFVAPKDEANQESNEVQDQEAQVEDQEQEQEEEQEEEEGIQLEGFIEVTRAKVFREAASYEQRIPDNLQKIDALNDFMSGLDPLLQKDPKALRTVRILVETLFDLKQSTIAYRDDHSIQGTRDLSARSISELIERTTVPLGRPVLQATKKLYESEKKDDAELPNEITYLSFEDELKQMLHDTGKSVSTSLSGAKISTIIREWSQQQAFNKMFLSPCILHQNDEPLWRAFSDSEYFRSTPPSSTENDGVITLLRTLPGYIASHQKDADPIRDDVPFGLERALSITYRKGLDQRKKQVLSAEETATIESYIMFPLSVAKYLGSTRSRYITTDSGRSHMPSKTMKMILEERGTPQDVGSSKDIILLKVSGASLGNISLADYIEGISVPALGLGDTFDTLEQYGMEHLELNRDIAQVLLNKIEKYQSQLLSTLTELRNMNREAVKKEPVLNPFLENPHILDEIRNQTTLAEALAEYERINPTLATSDIGQVLYLLCHYPILFQVAAGKNAVLIGKATLYTNMTNYLDYRHITTMNRYNEKNAGQKPERNTCQHVAMLVSIRKIIDDSDRFQQLATFFKKYQGGRDKVFHNWINCNVCKKHLLCVHETLQLQAYLNPKEKETLEKEIILKCSGGQFQGKYICRNCGQSIRELDFDNGLEFDDNGKPKSGRSVLIDEDALFDEKLKKMLSIIDEPSKNEEIQLDVNETADAKETNAKFYNTIREIAEQVGIQLDDASYRRIIMRVVAFMNQLPSDDVYYKTTKSKVDYQVFLARHCIAACGLLLLIEIQTKIPSYVVRYSLMGCKSPGFNGYPLDPNPANKQGIEYVACAISSITKKEAPWNQSGFQLEKDDNKRQNGIAQYMIAILEGRGKGVISDAMIQYELAGKRTYLLETLGSSTSVNDGRPKDMIPPTFLPEQIIVTPEQAAKDAIRPDVAANMGNKGKMALVKLWIRRAHELAKETALLIRGSPLMETTCCLSTIAKPGVFFIENMDMPSIGKRDLQPYQQGQLMLTEFIPRPTGTDVVSADKDLYYRIFLKCCFQGDRMGHSHEPGLTHRCHWCQFQFPTHPAVMDTDTEGKAALITQDVETNTAAFTNLLDTIHTVNKVEPIDIKRITSVIDIMRSLGEVVPEPIAGWSVVVQETATRFLKLPSDAGLDDIVTAAGKISNATRASEEIIYERLTHGTYHTIMDDIARLSWMNFFQVIQTYFITPFQRVISNFDKASLIIPVELAAELSKTHVTEDLQPILNDDTLLLSTLGTEMRTNPELQFARIKLQHYINQMRVLLSFKNSIRSTVVPGRHLALEYIQRALFYGPLSTLLHSAEIPEGAQIKSAVKSVGNQSMTFLLKIVAFTLNKYNKEKLSFDDKEIKNMIEVRAEKERVHVVAEFNKLTDEERRIELDNKRLGIGKWAVGGTKVIYAYNKEYYDQERQKRMAAGIGEFPGQEDESHQGREADELWEDEDNEMGDDGYDLNQHGDDDNE